MVTITDIETAGPDRRARRLHFSDGQTRLTSATVLKQLELSEGDEVAPEDLELLIEPLEAEAARERALRVLGYRERSSAELHKRLRDDGYPDSVARAVTNRFCELALVDDERYAQAYVRSRAASGYSRSRILRELGTRGIDPETAAHAVDDCDLQPEADRARTILRGHVPRDRKERDRALRRLVSRGYGFADAISAIDASEDDVAE